VGRTQEGPETWQPFFIVVWQFKSRARVLRRALGHKQEVREEQQQQHVFVIVV
jgi:hypothetical protein